MRLNDFHPIPARARRLAAKVPSRRALKLTIASIQGTTSGAICMKMDGGLIMAARETFAQREKRELDLQLDQELEGTFPASDPLKITRCSAKSRSVAHKTPKKLAVRENNA
jgi:hypothetical protein